MVGISNAFEVIYGIVLVFGHCRSRGVSHCNSLGAWNRERRALRYMADGSLRSKLHPSKRYESPLLRVFRVCGTSFSLPQGAHRPCSDIKACYLFGYRYSWRSLGGSIRQYSSSAPSVRIISRCVGRIFPVQQTTVSQTAKKLAFINNFF